MTKLKKLFRKKEEFFHLLAWMFYLDENSKWFDLNEYDVFEELFRFLMI